MAGNDPVFTAYQQESPVMRKGKEPDRSMAFPREPKMGAMPGLPDPYFARTVSCSEQISIR
jgi:hypothetical protein